MKGSIPRSGLLRAQEATREELHELGIFVHDYELYTASQLSYILPILKYMPKYATGEIVMGFAA